MGIIRRNGGSQTAVFKDVKSFLGADINPALTIEVFKASTFVRLFSSYSPHDSKEDERVVEIASLDRKSCAFYARGFIRRYDMRKNPYWDDFGGRSELSQDRILHIKTLLDGLGTKIFDSFDTVHHETLNERLTSFGVSLPSIEPAATLLSRDVSCLQLPIRVTI